MTIDERLDKLTERHEALTQTVELMAHMQESAWAKHEAALKQVIAAIDGLARIAQAHEHRISDLEGGQA